MGCGRATSFQARTVNTTHHILPVHAAAVIDYSTYVEKRGVSHCCSCRSNRHRGLRTTGPLLSLGKHPDVELKTVCRETRTASQRLRASPRNQVPVSNATPEQLLVRLYFQPQRQV